MACRRTAALIAAGHVSEFSQYSMPAKMTYGDSKIEEDSELSGTAAEGAEDLVEHDALERPCCSERATPSPFERAQTQCWSSAAAYCVLAGMPGYQLGRQGMPFVFDPTPGKAAEPRMWHFHAHPGAGADWPHSAALDSRCSDRFREPRPTRWGVGPASPSLGFARGMGVRGHSPRQR